MRVNDCEAVTMVLTFLWFWLDIALTFCSWGVLIWICQCLFDSLLHSIGSFTCFAYYYICKNRKKLREQDRSSCVCFSCVLVWMCFFLICNFRFDWFKLPISRCSWRRSLFLLRLSSCSNEIKLSFFFWVLKRWRQLKGGVYAEQVICSLCLELATTVLLLQQGSQYGSWQWFLW